MIVTVYSKPGCQPCRATLKRIVGPEGMNRPVRLVIEDARDHVDRLAAWGFSSAPVVEVTADGAAPFTRWSGYNPPLIDATLPPLEPA